jgi:hypothetical protein
VVERWPEADHDEAVELWNAVSAEQRPESEPLSDEVPKETLSVDGHITTLKCGHKDVQPDLNLTRDGKVFPFHLKDLLPPDFQTQSGTVKITSPCATIYQECER